MRNANRAETRKVELVETDNIARAIHRLKEAGPCDFYRWRRALHHALSMNYMDRSILEKVRIALELP